MTNALTPSEIGKKKFLTLRDTLDRMKGQFAAALPKHMNADRVMRIALTQVSRNPGLLECTPTSFAGALMLACQVGLEPDGVMGRAYLIPRKIRGTQEVCFQVGYLGQVELCQNSGKVKTVIAEVVHEGDELEEERGSNAHIKHKPGGKWDAPIIGAYAIIKTVDGGEYTSGYWPIGRLLAHKARYVKNERDDSIWKTNPEWAYKKTCIVQAAKLAPKSVEQRIAIAAEELSDAGLSQAELVDLSSLADAIVDINSEDESKPKSNVDALKKAAKKTEGAAAGESEAQGLPKADVATSVAGSPSPEAGQEAWRVSESMVEVYLDVLRRKLLGDDVIEAVVRGWGGKRMHEDGQLGLRLKPEAQRGVLTALRDACKRTLGEQA